MPNKWYWTVQFPGQPQAHIVTTDELDPDVAIQAAMDGPILRTIAADIIEGDEPVARRAPVDIVNDLMGARRLPGLE